MRWVSVLAATCAIALGCSSDDSSPKNAGSGGTAASGGGGAGTGGTATGGGAAGTGGTGTGASGGAGGTGGDAATAPPVSVALPCGDTASDLYLTPSGLPQHTPAVRGDVVRCTTDAPVAADAVSSRLSALKIAMTATTGVKRYRIAYRTERAGGGGAVGTAIVALPDPPPTGPLPIIVVTHGTSGLADSCAPSKTPDDLDYLVYPFAGTGLPVIAPDYAGLGTEGVQGYGDGVDTGQSVLDAARALRKLVTPGSLSPDIIVSGHSQGGGAALNAQSLASSYGSDGTVRAVIPFAPGWQDSPKPEVAPYKYANLVPTSTALGVPAAVAALYAYADQYNGVGPANPGALFNATIRNDVVQLIEGSCVLAIALSLPQKAKTFADLFEQAYLDGVVSCLETTTCNEPAKGFLARLAAHYKPIDPSGAKILILQGLQDGQATPERTACYVKQMVASGAAPAVCADAQATHFDVVQRNIPFARSWVDALLTGKSLPPCSTTGSMPTCN